MSAPVDTSAEAVARHSAWLRDSGIAVDVSSPLYIIADQLDALMAERDAALASLADAEEGAANMLANMTDDLSDMMRQRDAAAEQRDELLAIMQAAIGAVEIERDAALAAVKQARRDEREACAEILDSFVCDLNKGKLSPVRNDMPDVVRGAYAAAIRARSQENNNDT